MWRYPSTGQLLRGTMAFRPRKFEAITGIPSKRESSARVDYVPALCTHRPSLLPIEWSGEELGSRRRGAVRRRRRRENSTEPYHLEEGEVVTREADGGRRCVPVGCGTARAGPPIDSGRGPVRIGAAAKARAVDMPVEMPSRRSWLAARAVTACLGTLRAPGPPACGHPIRPVLKHGPRSLTCVGRRGCFVEPCHGIESSKWAIFGKQNWRCGMNRKPGYGAKLRANLEPTKGVGRLRQQDGGHGSRNPLRSV
ncbi:hypothetical protein L6452_46545 [Arctium lappa]|nr:hypothetical protein L6452_46545 [Arctium lappa]